jgi:hypothetical protein
LLPYFDFLTPVGSGFRSGSRKWFQKVVSESGFGKWFWKVVLESGIGKWFGRWFQKVVLEGGFIRCSGLGSCGDLDWSEGSWKRSRGSGTTS